MKNLKNNLAEGELLKPIKDEKTEKRQRRERKEKKNDGRGVLGGILAVISIVAVVLLIRSFDGNEKSRVAGVETKQASAASDEEAAKRVRKNLEKRINAIKKQVENLDVGDAISSSEQVQKLIEDLQSLQQVPQNQLKDACLKVCGGL